MSDTPKIIDLKKDNTQDEFFNVIELHNAVASASAIHYTAPLKPPFKIENPKAFKSKGQTVSVDASREVKVMLSAREIIELSHKEQSRLTGRRTNPINFKHSVTQHVSAPIQLLPESLRERQFPSSHGNPMGTGNISSGTSEGA
jgi:hypothetical protein